LLKLADDPAAAAEQGLAEDAQIIERVAFTPRNESLQKTWR
jgi:hypothetical protein